MGEKAIAGTSGDQSRVELYLRVRESVNQEKPKAVPLPYSSNQTYSVSEIVDVLKEDLHESEIDFQQIRIYDQRIKAFRRVKEEELFDAGFFDESCIDVLWEKNVLKNKQQNNTVLSPASTSSETVSLKSKVESLEKSLAFNNKVIEALITVLTADGQIPREFSGILETTLEEPNLQVQLSRLISSPIRSQSIQRAVSSIDTVKYTQSNNDIQLIPNISKAAGQDKTFLHFGILYSNPLVDVLQGKKGKNNVAYLLNDPVNFVGECNNILECLKKFNKSLNVDIQCANQEEFSKMISNKPLIMHIVCHGSFDTQQQEYFLEFETPMSELMKLTPTLLRDFLNWDNLSNTKLVFINACHSEGVGTVFLEKGVNCLVVVKSEHKVNDDFASKFSNCFYSELLQGRTINAAFAKAKQVMKSSDLKKCQTCCCGHSHKPNCPWDAVAKTQDYDFAHSLHEVVCNCPEAYARIHEENCSWLRDFEIKYTLDESCVKQISDKEVQVCCCCPEIPHSEELKMLLIYRENKSEYGEEVLFPSLSDGAVNLRNKNFCGRNLYQISFLGQNRLIYNMIKQFFENNKRIIYLVGDPGWGKSTICQYFYNYMEERHKFEKLIPIIEMSKSRNLKTIDTKISGGLSNFGDMEDGRKGLLTLIIIDNLDDVVLYMWEKFNQKMKEYLEQTKLRFIITLSSTSLIESKLIHKDACVLNIPNLNAQIAAKLLKSMAGHLLPMDDKNIYSLQTKDLFVKLRHSPVTIKEIANELTRGKNFNTILANRLDSEKEKGQQGVRQTAQLSGGIEASLTQSQFQPEGNQDEEHLIMVLNQIKESETTYNLLCFLACFPNGIFLNDLIDSIEMNLLPNMPSDWMSPLIHLFSMSPNNIMDAEKIQQLDNEIARYLSKGYTFEETVSSFLKYTGQSKDTWISIRYATVANKEELLIVVKHNLHLTIEKVQDGNIDILKGLVKAIKFHQLFLSSIIQTYKEHFGLEEDIIEYSAISYSTVWTFLDPLGEEVRYFTDKRFSESELKAIFKHHDSNYKVLINRPENMSILSAIKHAFDCSEDEKFYIVEAIEDFLIKILTVNKIFEEFENCTEYARLIQDLMKSEQTRRMLKRLNFKVEMYLAYLQYTYMKRTIQNSTQINKAELWERIEIINELLDEMDSNEEIFLHYSEFYTLKLYFLKLQAKGMSGLEAQTINDEIDKTKKNLFREAIEIKRLSAHNQDYDHNWAKAFLALLIEDSQQTPKSSPTKKVLLDTEIDFAKENCPPITSWPTSKKIEILDDIYYIFEHSFSNKLEVTALDLLCKLLSPFEADAEDANPAKCLEYAEKGLEISRIVKMTTFEREFSILVDNLKKRIRYQQENKFIFLQACPLDMTKPDELLCIGKNMRESLHDIVTSLDMNISITFDYLTRKTFHDLFNNELGWKLMVLDLSYQDEGGMVIENEHLGSYILGMEEIRRLVLEKQNLNVDVLLVLNDNPESVINFLDNTSIKSVVYFDFKDIKPQPSAIDFLTPYWKEEFKHKFLRIFLENFVKGEGALTSVEQAKIETREKMNHWIKTEFKLFKSTVSSYQSRSIPETITNDSIDLSKVDVIYFSESEIKCSLEKGKVTESSHDESYWSRAFWEDNQFSIPRNKEVYDLYKILQTHTHVNLTGGHGVGKSFIVKELVWELNARKVYRDGAFYFPLDEIKSNQCLIRQFMSEQLGQEFIRDTAEFFKERQCLIILDSYEMVVNLQIAEPEHLLKVLEENKVHTIFVTSDVEGKLARVPNTVEYRIEPLSPSKSLLFFLAQSIPYKIFFNFDEVTKDKLLKSDSIAKEGGNLASMRRRVKRFFERELSLNNYDNLFKKKQFFHSSSLVSNSHMVHGNSGDIDSSRYLDLEMSEQLSRFGENMQIPGLLNFTSMQPMTGEDGTPNGSMSKGSRNNKSNKLDSKKDSKHPKHKAKKKNKKNMS
jgi:hypothetical protein